MEAEKRKNNITGRKQQDNRPIFLGNFGPPKSETILPDPTH